MGAKEVVLDAPAQKPRHFLCQKDRYSCPWRCIAVDMIQANKLEHPQPSHLVPRMNNFDRLKAPQGKSPSLPHLNPHQYAPESSLHFSNASFLSQQYVGINYRSLKRLCKRTSSAHKEIRINKYLPIKPQA